MDDLISRQAAIDAVTTHGTELERRGITVLSVSNYKQVTVDLLESLPSTQPDITPDGTLNVTVDADIANVGRILLSQTGTQRGGLYYKDAQPETCDTCKHGYFGDGKCDYCRERYPSHYERRTDEQTKD